MFTPSARFATFAAVVAAALIATADACSTAPFGYCGNNGGISCCPDNQYCQPWNDNYFQCRDAPAQCSQQFTNTDFYGDDIKAVYGVQPEVCCDICANTPGCTSYTFINNNPGSPVCYLKSGAATDRRPLTGAVSGIVNGASPPSPPTPVCNTAPFGACGDRNGVGCCSGNQYCQPWNDNYYQCLDAPAQCGRQLTDTDFYGNDIKTVYVNHPTLCCNECAKTPGCKAYTYINNNPGQPVCYLKSAAGAPSRLVGAVAGQLN